MRCSREGDHILDVLHAGRHHNHPFESQTKTAVRNSSVLSEVSVPPVGINIEVALLDPGVEHVKSVLSGRASNDLSDLGHKHVHSLDCLVIVVQLHVEGLDLLGVVINDNWTLEHLVCQVLLVLTGKIASPEDLVLELEFLGFVLDVSLEDLDALCVCDSLEFCSNDLVESLNETLLDSLVEEVQVILVVEEDVFHAELNVIFSAVHVVLQGGEDHLGLDHPELAQMSRGVAVLGSEGGTECVAVSKADGDGLDIELARDRKESGLAEHVLLVVDSLLLERDGLEVEEILLLGSVSLLLLLVLLWFLAVSEVLSCLLFLNLCLGCFNCFNLLGSLGCLELSDKLGISDWFGVFRQDGCHSEHLTSSFTVGGSDDWGVDVQESSALEELMGGVGERVSDSDHGSHCVGSVSQMGNFSQVLHDIG